MFVAHGHGREYETREGRRRNNPTYEKRVKREGTDREKEREKGSIVI